MPFDFKKEYKEFYMPKNKPEIVNVPKANYIAVRGKGDPMKENIRACDEDEIGFSFVFSFDVEGKQILEFVKLLRHEDFYY